jgi:hypothetical protein
MLLPKNITISQTDKYDPEPEVVKLRRLNIKKTWHLTASTTKPATNGQFLTVLAVHHQNAEKDLPKIKLIEGTGAVGVTLTKPDRTIDTVAFRTDPDMKELTCNQIGSKARVFAQGRDKNGKPIRNLDISGNESSIE